ncbi:hypothetical protein [uncultured Polaribacter sp.]|uniref:hypothetical protein n=1 Tax=uncultured Polaribacter sp. TaxID=174711 RepID=UPI00260FB272|nr:hypothetical protein [uncultured Polaribacter sp.]
MIIYNVKHNFIEIAEHEMKSHLDNKKLKATIFQEETISPFRKRLTSNKTGLVSFVDNNEEINPAHWTNQIENEFIKLRNQTKTLPTYSKLGILSYLMMAIFGFLLFVFIKYADFENSTIGKQNFEKEFLQKPNTNAALILETTRTQKTIPYQIYYVLGIKGDTVLISRPGGVIDLKDKISKFDSNDKRKPIKIYKSELLKKQFKEYGKSNSRRIIEIRKQNE